MKVDEMNQGRELPVHFHHSEKLFHQLKLLLRLNGQGGQVFDPQLHGRSGH
jgi:hypothetical protein